MFILQRPQPAPPAYLKSHVALRVLVCGAQGWIGRAVVTALKARGHHVLCGQQINEKKQPNVSVVPMNFLQDIHRDIWIPRLQGIDVVINTIGIFSASSTDIFQRVHIDTPMALFEACNLTGVRRIIQLSALINPTHEYFPYKITKQASETLLRTHYKNWIIIRPSMIIGDRGRNSSAFRSWASMPILGIPTQASGKFQPIGLNDVVTLIVKATEGWIEEGTTLDAVGQEIINYQQLIKLYRQSLGLPPAHILNLPRWLSQGASYIAQYLFPKSVISLDALKLLEAGSTADFFPVQKALGHRLTPLSELIRELETPGNRAWAIQGWVRWSFQIALTTMWLIGTITILCFSSQHHNAVWFHLHISQIAALICTTIGILTFVRPNRTLWKIQSGCTLPFVLNIIYSHPIQILFLESILFSIPIWACLLYLWATEK